MNLFFSFPAAIIITWKLKENKSVIILPSAANENPQVPDRIRNTLNIKEYRMFVCSTLYANSSLYVYFNYACSMIRIYRCVQKYRLKVIKQFRTFDKLKEHR